VQFPWRFLSIQAVACALVIAQLSKPLRRLRWMPLLLGGLFVVVAMWRLQPERLNIGEGDVSAGRLRLYELFTGNIGSTVRYEYLPRWVEPRPFTSEAATRNVTKAPPLVVEGEVARAQLATYAPDREAWDVEVTSGPATLAFQTYYFPGWRAYADGEAAGIAPLEGLGYIQLRVPAGEHRVVLRFQRTRTRALVEAISLLAILAVFAVLVRGKTPARRWLRPAAWVVLAVCGLALGLRLAALADRAAQPVATETSDLTMDFARQPYLHHNPNGVSFSGQARLTGYRLPRDQVRAGEELPVTLLWGQVREGGLVAETRLVSLAEPLFQADAPLSEHRAPLRSGTSDHLLTVPQRAVPGVYLVSVRVWQDGRQVGPTTETGQPLGTTYLQPVRVDNTLQGDPPAKTRGEFGPCIALVDVTATQRASKLGVELLWYARCPILRNYAMSLRLKTREGRTLNALDIQPHHGFYPTSFWKAGDLVPDQCVLSLPEGTPPGGDYVLEIVLYEAKTLEAIGTVSVPGITLTQPTIKSDYVALRRFPAGVDLIAAELRPASIEEGQAATIAATWAAATQPSRDYACRIILKGDTGTVALEQVESLAPGLPTSRWPRHALLNGEYHVTTIPAGTYEVSLEIVDEREQSYGAYTLPVPLVVEARPREFGIPEMQTDLDVAFGGCIRLLGYDLEQKQGALHLTLYWQAVEAPSEDYKVFVHVFDPVQEQIVAQRDLMPRNNTYPTTLWAAEEVVRDDIVVPLAQVPAGSYRIAVGLYSPRTSDRLQAVAGQGVAISADRVFLPDGIQVP